MLQPIALVRFAAHRSVQTETIDVGAQALARRGLARLSTAQRHHLVPGAGPDGDPVGQRPHVVSVNEQYRRLISGYMLRHEVPPGIASWAQVNGYRGGDDLPSMTKRIEYDLDYLRHWSVWLDFKILVHTVLIVFRTSSAYWY